MDRDIIFLHICLTLLDINRGYYSTARGPEKVVLKDGRSHRGGEGALSQKLKLVVPCEPFSAPVGSVSEFIHLRKETDVSHGITCFKRTKRYLL